jgi:serine/threonine-protein kinase
VIGALLAGVTIGVSWSWLRPTATQIPRPVSRWTWNLPVSSVSDIALSPDGTRLVYAGPAESAEPLTLRMLDRQEGKPLAGTAGGVGPVFSPDGKWILFYEGYALKKVPMTGGLPVPICKAENQRGRTWGDDDTIVYGTIDGGLMRVSAAGGTPQRLTTPDRQKGEMTHQWPHFLPGSRAIVFTIALGTSYDTSQIAVLDVARGSYHTVVNGGSGARYVPKSAGSPIHVFEFRTSGVPRGWGAVAGPEHRVGGPKGGPASVAAARTTVYRCALVAGWTPDGCHDRRQ